MKPSRLTRARQLAGLSQRQAAKLMGWTSGQMSVSRLERGITRVTDDQLRRFAEIYGVSVAWLRGEDVELPESTRQVLRQVEHAGDRARLTELLTAIQGGPRR